MDSRMTICTGLRLEEPYLIEMGIDILLPTCYNMLILLALRCFCMPLCIESCLEFEVRTYVRQSFHILYILIILV